MCVRRRMAAAQKRKDNSSRRTEARGGGSCIKGGKIFQVGEWARGEVTSFRVSPADEDALMLVYHGVNERSFLKGGTGGNIEWRRGGGGI